jgi:hypothetical protein
VVVVEAAACDDHIGGRIDRKRRAEAAEQIGGYYVLDAPDLDTVISLCRILPPYDIDIRPALDVP